MASSFENYNKRRLISSYFSVVLSIFLVLFLLGTLGLFVINSKKISDDFKENIVNQYEIVNIRIGRITFSLFAQQTER